MSQGALPLDGQAADPVAWSGTLSELLAVLTSELADLEPGSWRFRLLRHGAMVAAQIALDGRRIVRIARPDRPRTPHGWTRWEREVETFQKHLGLTGWHRLPGDSAAGVAVRFQELWPGECTPGRARCGCGKWIHHDPVWGSRQSCDRCARLAGDEETRVIKEGG